MTTTGTIELAGLDGGHHTLTSEQLEDLDSRVQGRLLMAGDQGWNEAVAIWNGMAARLPALVLQPASAHDVAAAVGFARDHGLLLSVKGGGHNIAGTSMPGRLTLEPVPYARGQRRPPGQARPGRRAVCSGRSTRQPGPRAGYCARLRVRDWRGRPDPGRRLWLSVPPLRLDGRQPRRGRGRRCRRPGPNCQRDQASRAVLGPAVVGGNFGSFTGSASACTSRPDDHRGLIIWSAERADEVLSAYRDLTESAPRELTAAAIVRLAPPAPFLPQVWHGKPIAGIQVCHSGANADADLAPVRALGNPIVDVVGPKPYVAMQSMLNAMEPKWLHRYWKAEFFPGLSSGSWTPSGAVRCG